MVTTTMLTGKMMMSKCGSGEHVAAVHMRMAGLKINPAERVVATRGLAS
jgi:hypothetical protein